MHTFHVGHSLATSERKKRTTAKEWNWMRPFWWSEKYRYFSSVTRHAIWSRMLFNQHIDDDNDHSHRIMSKNRRLLSIVRLIIWCNYCRALLKVPHNVVILVVDTHFLLNCHRHTEQNIEAKQKEKPKLKWNQSTEPKAERVCYKRWRRRRQQHQTKNHETELNSLATTAKESIIDFIDGRMKCARDEKQRRRYRSQKSSASMRYSICTSLYQCITILFVALFLSASHFSTSARQRWRNEKMRSPASIRIARCRRVVFHCFSCWVLHWMRNAINKKHQIHQSVLIDTFSAMRDVFAGSLPHCRLSRSAETLWQLLSIGQKRQKPTNWKTIEDEFILSRLAARFFEFVFAVLGQKKKGWKGPNIGGRSNWIFY